MNRERNMKFKVGDKVRSELGNGEIVFIREEYTNIYYLVKIKGLNGHVGSARYGYVNKDGLKDKWWFKENQLELIKKEKQA